MLFHLSLMMGDARYGGVPVFEAVTRHGNLGVEFFFVLSGFIILHAHHRDVGRPNRLGRYAFKRFTRLFPVYWLYTAGFAVLVIAGFGGASTLPDTLIRWLQSLILVRFDATSPPLAVAWTLFHEIAFYALFGVLILHRRAGIAVLALWALVCVAAWQSPTDLNRTPIAVYTAQLNLLFFMGMGAWALRRRLGVRSGLAVGGVGFAMLAAGLADRYLAIGGYGTILWFGIAFALLLAALTAIEAVGRLTSPRPLNLLGDASYTLYLTHLPIQGLLLKIAGATGLVTLGGPAVFVLVICGNVVLGLAAYLVVEQTILRLIRRAEVPSPN
jgi:peptidoglycan/LPS O-acetylase OafA/YrhL